LELLAARGTPRENITIYNDPSQQSDKNTAGYCLISVQEPKVEIAVCDEINHATYIGAGQRGPTFWNGRNKQEILDVVGIVSIIYRSKSQYLERLSAVITELSTFPVSEDEVQVVVRPGEYDIKSVRRCIEEHIEQTGEVPNSRSGIILFGPYANGKTTWHGISQYLLKLRTVHENENNCPTLHELIREVAVQLRVYDAYAFRSLPLTEEGIKETVHRFYVETGEWPTIKNSVVKVGPYSNKITWSTIDNALRAGNRGLKAGSSLTQVRDQVSAELNFDTKAIS